MLILLRPFVTADISSISNATVDCFNRIIKVNVFNRQKNNSIWKRGARQKKRKVTHMDGNRIKEIVEKILEAKKEEGEEKKIKKAKTKCKYEKSRGKREVMSKKKVFERDAHEEKQKRIIKSGDEEIHTEMKSRKLNTSEVTPNTYTGHNRMK